MALEPNDSAGFLLWRATLHWQRGIAAALRPLELTHVQFVLLASTWWLNRQGERPSQLAVAQHAATDIKMSSEVLRKLETKGLIERDIDPADSRARRLTVTVTGTELAERAIAAVEGADREFFGRLPAADARALTAALRTLAG
jgi:DNA-binding MarR family transcriptional regulator